MIIIDQDSWLMKKYGYFSNMLTITLLCVNGVDKSFSSYWYKLFFVVRPKYLKLQNRKYKGQIDKLILVVAWWEEIGVHCPKLGSTKKHEWHNGYLFLMVTYVKRITNLSGYDFWVLI